MDRRNKRYLKDLEKRLTPEEMKSRKHASKLRRAAQDKGKPRVSGFSEDNWEDLLDQHGHEPKSKVGDDEPIDTHIEEGSAAAGDHTDAPIVIYVASGRCRVFTDGNELDVFVPPEVAMRQKSILAVGDRVRIAADEGGVWRLQSILPRHSILARPDPLHKHRQRLIAANVDVVIHVVSVKAPPLRPRLIDRYLIAIQRGGARPVICVNKVDLLGDDERAAELEKLDVYRRLGVTVTACSTETGEGIDELRQEVEGKMAALVGHSGVGKSSILNALDSRLQLVTKTLHRRGTGRHTTTASTLYDFGGGTYLIDTPGIREFGLWDLDRESLRDYFPELDDASELCRFTNCTHVHEPNCEVKERVERNELDPARYETYVRLWHDLK
jgi:ribosome biogenesis GTPase